MTPHIESRIYSCVKVQGKSEEQAYNKNYNNDCMLYWLFEHGVLRSRSKLVDEAGLKIQARVLF